MKAYIKPETIAYDLLFGKAVADGSDIIGTSGTNEFETRRQDYTDESLDWSSDDFWGESSFSE